MAEEEYEILPHKLLSDLKFDVEALKKKLTQPDTKMNELILEIESMKDSIHELNVVFEKALEMTKKEDVGKTITEANNKIDTVVSQNEVIAKGMIAISDKLEEFMSKWGAKPMPAAPALPSGIKHTMGPPAMPGRTAPMPSNDVPPPPPEVNEKKRKGIFK